MASENGSIKQMLPELSQGNQSVLEKLTRLVYGELRLALDEALTRLASFDEHKAQIIELRFFGGMTEEEIVEALGISLRPLGRDLRLAKAWLEQVMTSQPHGRAAVSFPPE